MNYTDAFRKPVLFVFLILLLLLLRQGELMGAELTLEWGQSSGNVEGYKILRYDGRAYSEIGTTEANVLSFRDSRLLPATRYCYTVRAFNSAGVSDQSNAACATTPDSSSADSVNVTLSMPVSPTSTLSSQSLQETARVDSKWSDYTFLVKIRSTDTGAIGVTFRHQDNDNYYRFSWSDQEPFRRLENIERGTKTVLASDDTQYVLGKTYQLQITAQESVLAVHIDDELVFSVNDGSHPSGTVALYSYLNGGTFFDDVIVQDLATGVVLAQNDFDSDRLLGWTIIDDPDLSGVPSAWSVQNGTLVQTNQVGSHALNEPGTLALYSRGHWTDYRVTFEMSSTDNACLGLMFRYQDPENYYRFSSCNNGNLGRRLEKMLNGKLSVLAEDATPHGIDRTYQVEILARDTTLAVNIDDSPVFSVTDPSFDVGTVALYSWRNRGSLFNNILVEDLSTGNVLLWDNFDAGVVTGWTIVDDTSIDAPSVWAARDGTLMQTSEIGSTDDNRLGTFALY